MAYRDDRFHNAEQQPAGVLATWIEEILRREIRPWLDTLAALSAAVPAGTMPDSAGVLQHLQRLRSRLELLEWPQPRRTGLVGGLRRLLAKDPEDGAGSDAQWQQLQAAFALARDGVHRVGLAHEGHARALRRLALHLSLDLGRIERLLDWCDGLLGQMRRKLLVRRPDGKGRGSRELLVDLAARLRLYGSRLHDVRALVGDARNLSILVHACLAHRESALAVLQGDLPALHAAWTSAAQRLLATLAAGRPADADLESAVQATQRLQQLLALATNAWIQVRVDEEALGEAQSQLQGRLDALVDAPAWDLPDSQASGAAAPFDFTAPTPLEAGDTVRDDPDTDDADPDGRPPRVRGAAPSRQVGIAEVMMLARRNNRACPRYGYWAALHELLRQCAVRRQLGEPPQPVDSATWQMVSPLGKRLRLRDQLAWAEQAGCLGQVAEFLSSLGEDDWEHLA